MEYFALCYYFRYIFAVLSKKNQFSENIVLGLYNYRLCSLFNTRQNCQRDSGDTMFCSPSAYITHLTILSRIVNSKARSLAYCSIVESLDPDFYEYQASRCPLMMPVKC